MQNRTEEDENKEQGKTEHETPRGKTTQPHKIRITREPPP